MIMSYPIQSFQDISVHRESMNLSSHQSNALITTSAMKELKTEKYKGTSDRKSDSL